MTFDTVFFGVIFLIIMLYHRTMVIYHFGYCINIINLNKDNTEANVNLNRDVRSGI